MPKHKKGDLTRQHIRSIASILFLEKGYYATSVKDIIIESGVSKGAFYHHFTSKLELFKEIILEFLDIDRRLLDLEEAKDLPLDSAFKVFVTKYYEYMKLLQQQTGRSILHFQRMYFEAMIILPEVYEKVRNTYLHYFDFFVKKAMKERNVNRQQAEKIVKKYIFEYEGIFYWISIFPETPVEHFIDIMG